MGLFPEDRPLTGMEVGLILGLAALLVLCCLGTVVVSAFTG
jgi:Flp pilus assembly pilin Flp